MAKPLPNNSWVAGVARDGGHEKEAPTELTGCILAADRDSKTEILVKERKMFSKKRLCVPAALI
jgi:hypothetical protein